MFLISAYFDYISYFVVLFVTSKTNIINLRQAVLSESDNTQIRKKANIGMIAREFVRNRKKQPQNICLLSLLKINIVTSVLVPPCGGKLILKLFSSAQRLS